MLEDAAKKSKGGIHIAGAEGKKTRFGWVVAIGPHASDKAPPPYHVGDRLFFSDYAGVLLEGYEGVTVLDFADIRLYSKG